MADTTKKTYPRLSPKNWWDLRNRFKKTIPTQEDSTYLATVLNMSKESAQSNILPFLKMIVLIDPEGKTQDLAKRWRDDKEYPKVCKEMLEHVYPKSLLDTASDRSKIRDEAKRWFMQETGVGAHAANKMTAFYALLQDANVEGEKSIHEMVKKSADTKTAKRGWKGKPAVRDKTNDEVEETEDADKIVNQFPEIHINVQVHVSADSTPEQVDHLFASIAKHLKEFSIRKPK